MELTKKEIIGIIAILILTLIIPACNLELHIHTYSDTWSSNETYHWHDATCGHNVKSDNAEHMFGDFISNNDATAKSDGTKSRICIICGYTETVSDIGSKIHIHTYSDTWSCNETYHWHDATCGHDVKSDNAEHTFGDFISNNDATAKSDGTKSKTCIICGYTETVSDIGSKIHIHTYADTWSNDEKYHWHAATCCHTEDVNDKSEHIWQDVEIIKNATATGNGEKIIRCSICAYEENVEIEAIGSAGLSYSVLDGKITITGIGTCMDKDIFIPSKIDNKLVVAIGDSAFKSCNTIKSVVISENVSYIGKSAFYECENLVTVEIGKNVTEIDDYAFESCDSLQNVLLDDSLNILGSEVFRCCSNLESIVLPDNLNKLNSCTFSGCTKLNNIVLGNKLKSIGYGVFSGCVRLPEVSIPDSVITIDRDAFRNCSRLATLNLGNSLEEIGEYSFYGCGRLESITIPDSVLTIKEGAFSKCSKLNSIDLGNNLISIGSHFIDDCPLITEIIIPDSVVSVERTIFSNTNLKSITIGNGITSLVDEMFRDCTELTNIKLNNKIKEIGFRTFAGCNKLSEIDFPDTLLAIEDEAFSNCKNIKELYIPENVNTISENAFMYCSNLEKIEVDTNNTCYDSRDNSNAIIDSTNNHLIRGCINTKVPDSVTCYSAYSFSGCGIETFIISQNISVIGENAFAGCNQLSSLSIPGNVVTIENYAFSYCSNLSEITIEEGVKYLGSGVFNDTFSLENIKLPESLEFISTNAFDGINIEFSDTNNWYVTDSVTDWEDKVFGQLVDLEQSNYWIYRDFYWYHK